MEAGMRSTAMKKAILISGGPIRIAEDFRLPFLPSRSTAGPGAGSVAIVLTFDGARVKKEISRERGEFELVQKGEGYSLLWKGEPFIEEVAIKPTLFHSPEQAFFNVGSACIYDCKFCVSRKLDSRITKNLDPDRIVSMILEASEREDFRAVALTSAVVDSPSETVLRMAYIIAKVREALDPRIPIGVEPYIGEFEDIDRLKAAGADEIKINIETFDREIFTKVCGKLDFDRILRSIKYAVQVFGVGKVCSNIIVGLGETDDNVVEGVEFLARIGCVATLRPLKINEMNRKPLEQALGHPLEPVPPERIVRLAEEHRMMLELYHLSTLSFKTMCHACTCCDVVPSRDL